MTHSEITALLKKEMIPATGCTGPTAYALAAANCRPYMTAPPEEIHVSVSPAYLKMGLGVATPGTTRRGIEIAIAIGLTGGDPDAGLQVLQCTTPQQIEEGCALADQGVITVDSATGVHGIYVRCEVVTKRETVIALVEKTHDGVAYVMVNGEMAFKTDGAADTPRIEDKPDSLSLDDIFAYVERASLEEVSFLLNGYRMNLALAEDGLKQGLGMGSGRALLRKSLVERSSFEDSVSTAGQSAVVNISENPLACLPQDPAEKSDILVSAASDARMGGSHLPAMAAMGDGNQGITALLPVGVYAEWKGASELETVRALAFSCLMLFYVKMHIGRAAATCMCAIAASAGAAAGIGKIQGLDRKQICAAVKNTIVPLTGMLCDGAKNACALKMSIAVKTAISSIALAAFDVEAGAFDGIAADSLEQTVSNIANVVNQSMDIMDQLMVETMLKTTG